MPELRDDEEVVVQAVRRDSNALQFASSRLRGHRSVVLDAIRWNGLALEYAEPQMQSDPEVVAIAADQNVGALAFANDALLRRQDFMLHCIRYNIRARSYAHLSLWDDGYFADSVAALLNDPAVVHKSVSINGLALAETPAGAAVRGDSAIVATAVEQDGRALEFASKELRCSEEIVSYAVRENGLALQFACDELRRFVRGVRFVGVRHGLLIGLQLFEDVLVSRSAMSDLSRMKFSVLFDAKAHLAPAPCFVFCCRGFGLGFCRWGGFRPCGGRMPW